MAKKPRENRVPIMVSEEELTAIDDWRYENRVATRSEAIRRLCRLALIADRLAPDLFRTVREISDMDFIARLTMAKPELTDGQRSAIARYSDMHPDRVHMILKALTLFRMVSAFRDASSMEDALETAKIIEAEIAEELKHALAEPRANKPETLK